jgi:hypothetical protein
MYQQVFAKVKILLFYPAVYGYYIVYVRWRVATFSEFFHKYILETVHHLRVSHLISKQYGIVKLMSQICNKEMDLKRKMSM